MISPLENQNQKLTSYYLTAIFSLVFAVAGFTYNTWRLEVTEDNNNIRTASFAVLTLLSEFEQNIFAAYYDSNPVEGSPRIGWVKVGLIVDMSTLISEDVEIESTKLKQLWSNEWENVFDERDSVDQLTAQIDVIRADIKTELKALQ